MKFKNIARVLVSSLFLSNCYISSLAGALSADGRYESFEGNSITVNDVLEEDSIDLKIEGNTLVNLLNGAIRHNETDVKCSDLVRISSLTNGRRIASLFPDRDIGFGNTYTIVLDIENKNYAQLSSYVWYEDGTLEYNTFPFYSEGKGLAKSFKTQDKKIASLALYLSDYTESERYFEIKNVMLFEGDESSNPPQEYFEGMKSSFEENIVTQDMVNNGLEEAKNLGKYKAEIKVTGKNLFDKNLALRNHSIELGTGKPVIWTGEQTILYTVSNLIKIKPNTIYSVIADKQVIPYYYDDNNNFIGRYVSENNGYDYTFTTFSNASYMRIRFEESINTTLDTFQIEEGSIATEYEPYKESVKTFYLNSPLLEGDTIEKINGKATHVKRYGTVVLDGSEYWVEHGDGTQAILILDSTKSGGRCYSDILPTVLDGDFRAGALYEGLIGFGIVYNSSTLSSLDKVIIWLKNNPTTVVYELKNPVYESISFKDNNSDLSANLYKGTTHITSNNVAPVKISLTVDRVLNRATEAIELARANPTIENISKARMWTNMTKHSILKDSLQDSIDSITEITDLTIDKKKVSANLDLYVKSENALSMSLDTNSVTFENYNNTEDMEKLGAVNITVSSSLPYDLNAYMPNGISNLDGTKTMDSNLLNIREDSTTTYKPFVGIDTKVSLKEDCNAGNNNIHTIDFKLNGSQSYDVDMYRTVIKFEAQQK